MKNHILLGSIIDLKLFDVKFTSYFADGIKDLQDFLLLRFITCLNLCAFFQIR